MSAQQHSASLEIVENNLNPIEISQNSFEIRSDPNLFFEPDKIDDTFELSLDENSLSFQIQELKEQSTCYKVLKEGNINSEFQVLSVKSPVFQKQEPKPIPAIQQERKRKRKQIFEKYKQKTTENILADSALQDNNNDLINTIDEIFRIKSPQKVDKTHAKPSTSISKEQQEKLSKIESFGFRKKSQNFKVAPVLLENTKLIESHLKSDPNEPLVDKSTKIASLTNFEIPSQVTELQRIDSNSNIMIGSTNSFIMEPEVNKLSIIQSHEEEISRDSLEIQAFLQSQIFRQDLLQKTIRQEDTSYKNIEISMVNPSIMIHPPSLESPMNKLYNQNKVGLTRQKSERTLQTVSSQEGQQILKRNLSERKMKIFDTIHLKPEAILKEKPLSYEEARIPIYLRQIRKKNTIYPNFYIKNKNKDSYQQQNLAFRELLLEFKKGLNFLLFINELAHERYTILEQLQKKLLNSMTLETFLTCGFQKVPDIKEAPNLQPHQNFIKRKYQYEKVKEALNNYLYITQYYEKFDFNLQDPKAQKKYSQIRSKFWAIEKNIKMIGEDIYLLAVQQVFPPHYIQFLKALKGDFPQFLKPFQQLDYARKLLAKYYALRQSGDLLCLSEIGKHLKLRLQKIIHRTLMA